MGQSAAQNFVDGFKAQGGEIVATEFFNPGTRDFRAIITKIADKMPDAIYLSSFYEDGAAFLATKAQLGVKAKVFSASSLYEKKLIELAGPAADSSCLSTSFNITSSQPEVQKFVHDYEQRYQNEPTSFAAQAYDATNILLDAIVKAGGAKADRQKVAMRWHRPRIFLVSLV